MKIGGALVVIVAMTGFASASASANTPRWKVQGAYLGAGMTKPFTATSTASELQIPSLGAPIVCKKDSATGSIVGSAAGSPGLNKEVVISFEECSVEGVAVCSVPNFKSKKLKSELVWLTREGDNAGDRLLPEVGTVIANIVIEGPSCAFAGTNPVTGELVGQVLPVATEAVTGELDFPDPAIVHYWTGDKPARVEHTNGGVKFGSMAAVFSGNESVKLTGGEKFGVFE